jgi:solute carrier family 7 (L-type amino acid transporter), member 6
MASIDISPRSSMDTPLQISDNHPNLRRNEPEAPRLTFLNGLALVLGLQIGSGIFSAPSHVSLYVFSAGEGVLVWLFAGLLAWTGASSFIELGLAVPRNGGMQEYLQFCYGDFAGFLFTWIWVVIAKPSANAVIATVLADYLTSVFPFEATPVLLSKLVGVLAIVTIAFVNCLTAKAGPNVANGFLVLKLLLVISIITVGISVCGRTGKGVPSTGLGWFGGTDNDEQLPIWTRFGHLVTALLGALFCYGGWESVSISQSPQLGELTSLVLI